MTIIDHFWLKRGRHHHMVASVCLGNGNVAAGVSPGAFATDAAAGPADVGIPSETSAGEAAATAATALAWLHLVRGGKVVDLPTGLFSLPPDLFWLSVRLVKFTRPGNLPPAAERESAPPVVVSANELKASAPLGK